MFGEIKSLNGPSGRTITNLADEYRRYRRDPNRPKNRSSTIPQKREYDDASLHQSKATSTAEAVAPSSTTDGTTPLDPQTKSPVYSPRLEPTPTTNVGEVSLSAKIAELEKKAQSLEEEKSSLLQVIRDQAVAYNQLQRQIEEHIARCNHH
ncbi:hypothetical protein CFAM422_008132 [Trichoderma lentiforme]|uniref:Uncharacterized protein n=1 Tax=Trichoderma lentiforme TaxID=1567552 RepID=A0A9P5CAB5_9HYPO|nr:hypothetical protein CFAM422_008132 [Trichoderma lentiforme]